MSAIEMGAKMVRNSNMSKNILLITLKIAEIRFFASSRAKNLFKPLLPGSLLQKKAAYSIEFINVENLSSNTTFTSTTQSWAAHVI